MTLFFSIPKIGVIGFHFAQLPKNRGRHPIIWALAIGLKETASDLYQRILDIAAEQVRTFSLQFFNQQVKFVIQDNAEAFMLLKEVD